MPQIELDPVQNALLRDVVETYLSDLRMEIANTDSGDVRERLKGDEVILKDILRRLA